MEITINNQTIKLKYTFRGFMAYEQITNEAFNPTGLKNLITLFYAFVMVSDNQLTITFDEFIDWLDENPNKLNDFSNFIAENNERQNSLSPKPTEEVKGETDPKN